MMQENKTSITYQVKENESLIDVLDFLKETPYPRVFIEVSSEIEFFKNSLNLKLLKKECESLGKEIVFITRDLELQRLFEESGFEIEPGFYSENIEAQENIFQKHSGELQNYSPKIFDIIPPKGETIPFEREIKFPPKKEIIEEEIFPEIPEEQILKDFEEEPSTGRVEPEFLKEKKPILEPKPRFPIPDFKKLPKFKKPTLPKFGLQSLIFVFTGFALVVAGLSFYLILPKAKVVITPRSEKITYELTLTSDVGISQIDPVGYKIPGEILSYEESFSMDFLSSGKEVREERARGIITVYNSYSSSPQTLVETTRFISQDGKLFRTAKTVVIPGAEVEDGKIVPSSIDVEVVAAEIGEDYNVGPSTFAIPGFKGTPKYTAFYGKSTSSMSGGFKGEVAVITEEDFKKAEEELNNKISIKLNEELEKKLPKNLTLLEKAQKQEVLEMEADKNVGDIGEKFTLKAKARKEAFLFNKNDIGIIINQLLASQLGEKKHILEGKQDLRYQEVSADFKNKAMKLVMEADEWIVYDIDKDYIKENLAGQKEVEVRRFLGSLEEVADAKITLSPFWASKLPKDKEKIVVEVKMED